MRMMPTAILPVTIDWYCNILHPLSVYEFIVIMSLYTVTSSVQDAYDGLLTYGDTFPNLLN